MPEPSSAGSARGESAAASAPAAGACPQPGTWPPSAAAATPPKGSIFQPGLGSTRPADLGSGVRPVQLGYPRPIFLDGGSQLLNCRVGGAGDLAPRRAAPNGSLCARTRARLEGRQALSSFRLAAFAGRARNFRFHSHGLALASVSSFPGLPLRIFTYCFPPVRATGNLLTYGFSS